MRWNSSLFHNNYAFKNRHSDVKSPADLLGIGTDGVEFSGVAKAGELITDREFGCVVRR